MNNVLIPSNVRSVLAAVVLLPLGLNAAFNPSAPKLIDLSPGSGRESATPVGMSLAGDRIAGIAYNNPPFTDLLGFRWARGKGTQPIPSPADATYMFVNAISGDGNAITGFYALDDGSLFGLQRPFLWTPRGGTVDLSALPDGADMHGLSTDGSVLCGSFWDGNATRAIRWSQRDGLTYLGAAGGGDGAYALALGISGDGRSITGLTSTDNVEAAFLWTVRGGMRALPPAHPAEPSGGFAISTDAKVIAGYSGLFAAAWYNGTPRDLGGLAESTFSVAYAVSGDGRVIGGSADSLSAFSNATLWFRRTGAIDLNVLLPKLGVDLSGWTLDTVTALSGDGSTIAGLGTHNGIGAGWTIRVPELEENVLKCLGTRNDH